MNKVWTYLISRELSEGALKNITELGDNFVAGWTAHENKLQASFEIYKKRIIIIRVNEEVSNASGCSIDKLVRFIKKLESQFSVELLNRLLVAFEDGETIQSVHANKMKDLLAQKAISENSLIYNTSVSSEDELKDWKQPLKNTWLKKYLVQS